MDFCTHLQEYVFHEVSCFVSIRGYQISLKSIQSFWHCFKYMWMDEAILKSTLRGYVAKSPSVWGPCSGIIKN